MRDSILAVAAMSGVIYTLYRSSRTRIGLANTQVKRRFFPIYKLSPPNGTYTGYHKSQPKLPLVELTWNQYIRFNTSVDQATWDDTEKKWKVDVRVSNGKDSEYTSAYTIASDYLVSAVGKSKTSFQATPVNDSTESLNLKASSTSPDTLTSKASTPLPERRCTLQDGIGPMI